MKNASPVKALSRPVLAGLLLSASALCPVAQASLVQADYLAGGDQLAVLDTSQNLTWLDLSVSAGWSTSNWASNVAPGAGWRLATNVEVLNLLIDAFPSIGAPDLVSSQTYNSSSVLADIAGFTALFGRTWTDTRTYGFYQDEDAVWRMAGVDDFGSNRTLWGGEFGVNYNAQAAATTLGKRIQTVMKMQNRVNATVWQTRHLYRAAIQPVSCCAAAVIMNSITQL